jgi:two-component system nitrate/nitrite response regulator NarL
VRLEVEDMIRVLMVNETPLTCNAIASVLEGEPDMTVVGCAHSLEEALLLGAACDVALVSTDLGRARALELVYALKEATPQAQVLVLGLTESREQVLQFVQAGVTGYVLAEDSVEDMIVRIRSACEGQALISPKIAGALMRRLGELARQATQPAATIGTNGNGGWELTPRELEILHLIAEGMSNRQIAEKLVIEVGTVKNHVHNILQKLEVHSRKDAAATLALRQPVELSAQPASGLRQVHRVRQPTRSRAYQR